MPKLKTHRGTFKRVSITGGGKGKKLKRGKTGAIHFREKQSGSRQRSIAIGATIVGKLKKNIKRALGV
jgi:ribosomal protein L35